MNYQNSFEVEFPYLRNPSKGALTSVSHTDLVNTAQTLEHMSHVINLTFPMQANVVAYPEMAPLAVDERQRETVGSFFHTV